MRHSSDRTDAMLQVKVLSKTKEATDIQSLELGSVDGSPLPPFSPGDHIDVHVTPNIIRQYSLINGPGETDRYHIGVKLEPQSRGGSRRVHDDITVGQVLTISVPRNNFPLRTDASFSLLLAGGIGITPILSMARHLQAQGRPFALHYFTRARDHTAFRTMLAAPSMPGAVHFHEHADVAQVERSLGEILSARREGAHLYMCGPRPFMDLVATLAAAWPADTVHREDFSADPAALMQEGDTFKVKLARSGGVYEVAAGESIVDVLARHGIEVNVSCQQGICGTCLTAVLEGKPDHRDMYLTDDEKEAGKQMTPCISRSKSPLLVLDL